MCGALFNANRSLEDPDERGHPARQFPELASMQYPNGVAHAFSYDSRDRTTGPERQRPLGD